MTCSPHGRPRAAAAPGWAALLAWIVMAAPAGAGAAPGAAATLEAVRDVPRVAVAPVVDGDLGDAAWAAALRVDDFVARFPVEGAAPTLRSEVRLAATSRALFVALRAFDDRPETIRATALRRDDFALVAGDQFVIALDTFRDRRSGYWFSTNPAGVRVDAQFSDEGERFVDSWNGVWDAAARVDAEGWTAELAIPWSTLRFPAGDETVMGINLFRRIPRTHEQLFAPAIPLAYAQGTPNVSIARPYRFRGIAGGARLELRPFALASDASAPGGGESELDGGLFARVPVSDALTLSGTWRADFSEVEVDEAQLNLSRFPLFLPEKRDFFLEDAGSFAFGAPGEAELFFSRAVGFLIDQEGRATTTGIDWGVKAAGRHRRLELGALAAETGEAGGVAGERFDVARARVALAERSFAGGFWSRRSPAAGGGGDGSHTTAGVDASHVFPGEVLLRAFAARDEERGRRAEAWHAALVRGGERTAFRLSALSLDAGFDPAVGLVARPGTLRTEATLGLPWFPEEGSRVRRYAPSLSWVRYGDRAGDGFDDRRALSFEVGWRSDHALVLSLVEQRERLTGAFPIYRDVTVPAGDYQRWEGGVALSSNPARRVSGSVELTGGGLYGGEHVSAAASAVWQPGPRLSVSPLLLVDRADLPGGDFTAFVGRVRLGVAPTTHWSFDLLAQAESETRSLGGGVRARWEPREGSRVVLAWDGVEERPPLRAAGEPRRRREERGAIKLSYLLVF